ncbi:hypothetical protein GURASL_06910 [Geotalea uraniireducens]|uniref:Glycosyltransferase RgtA/B/C/D-like domain-containing protein n=1 Tax=Geotalea uraniireducens TaxID=351604 RepID=A0ABN6VNG4_9BACT|nr:glycosyltransferase family 39 protein [Geotalea uraniireducens]BDV41768.1 hypothetical protein GURASL_06910 [Geotalea uraniireducens]
MTETTCRLARRDWLLMGLLVVAALAIRLWFMQYFRVISADGIAYVDIARDIMTGQGLARATHYPPFYPLLVGGVASLVGDYELAGQLVSIVMGSLLAVPLYLLGREFFAWRVALLAGVLTIVWPSLRGWSNEVMSQATYITLMLLGVYWLWFAVTRRSALAAIAGGVALALAHLTRSEGVLVFAAVSAVILVGIVRRKFPVGAFRLLLLSWGSFWVAFAPYFFALHHYTGNWALTGKTRIALADGLSYYLQRPDLKLDPHFAAVGYLDLFREYPGYLWHNLGNNSRDCLEQLLPPLLWMLALLGGVIGWRGESVLLRRGYLLATFAPLAVIILFFFIGPEYTQPYLPVLLLFAAHGMVWLEGRFADRFGSRRLAPFSAGAVGGALVLIYAGYLVAAQLPADRGQPYNYTQDGGRYDDKLVGLRLRTLLPRGTMIMTRSGRVGFYSGHPYVLPPQADVAEIIAFAREHRVDYLVANLQLLSARPQLESLFAPLFNAGRPSFQPPSLELVYLGQEPGGLPYLVYRFR